MNLTPLKGAIYNDGNEGTFVRKGRMFSNS